MDNQQSGREGVRSTSSLNKVMIIGNLGGEPEMRFTPNGNPVTTFRVATNRVYNTPDGERREETEWFSVVTWQRLAENCNRFLTKGQKIYVEGRLHNRTWDGNDGQKHSRVEIIANNVIFLDKRAASPSVEDKMDDGEPGDIEPQDLPF
ncbi:MAG: single-stranded DNA-binding protein [Dehalococcoidales bacterium]|nr:single-stranded DNA-binding protein [Dehalococcoidales bacterium]